MDSLLRSTIRQNINIAGASSKFRRNTNKQSPVHYFFHPSDVLQVDNVKAAFSASGLDGVIFGFERGCHTITLPKQQTIPWILSDFSRTQKEAPQVKKKELCVINVVELLKAEEMSLDTLRHLVVTEHLKQILVGTDIVVLPTSCSIDIEDLVKDIICNGLKSLGDIPLSDTGYGISVLEKCKDVKKLDDDSWELSFQTVRVVQGNPLSKCIINKSSLLFQQLDMLVSVVCKLQDSISSGEIDIYHIVCSSRSYQHELMLEILAVILGESRSLLKHHTVFVGSVHRSQSNYKELTRYIDSCRSYLTSASVEKYGFEVYEKEFWKQRVDSLVIAAVKYEFLCRSPLQSIKLAPDVNTNCDLRAASFIMYNCSRLSTLFTNFEKQVSNGVYPPLVPIEEADFSLLRTDDEWILVFQYVNVYPQMVETIREQIFSNKSPPGSSLSEVVKFLHNLSRDFSTYYSRTHILGENKTHLISTMMSRIWLLKVIHSIFIDGLELIGVKPFDSM